ncbi:MAG: hypothetical protein PHW76_05060 [Alphaproteobacteria bacterium]|nr:hypothetical protein [Alphaproteobacteria bacterium]
MATQKMAKGVGKNVIGTTSRGRTNAIGDLLGGILLTVGLFNINTNIDANTFHG